MTDPSTTTGDVQGITRRSLLRGAAAAGLLGATGTGLTAAAAPAVAAGHFRVPPLWRSAAWKGLLYGSSTATWQISDPDYRRLFARHAALLWPEDDLLWYRLKPTPDAELDFSFADRIIRFAERNDQVVIGGPGLVWDEGFGEGWTDQDLWGIGEKRARRLLFGTLEAVVRRYRGRVPIWVVVNEAITNGRGEGVRGLRNDVPWYQTIGPEYVEEAFHLAHEIDPDAALVLNDFGYETVNEFGDRPEDKRRATLRVLDRLLGRGVPIHAFGVQGHLLADQFAERFHARAYAQFLEDVADRGLKILVTEMDVLDDGLPANPWRRDAMVADVYRRYLDVTLSEPAVAVVISFGLSDRYTWLQEDYPREDGTARRPLPFGQRLVPKPAYYAIRQSFRHTFQRWPTWEPKRELPSTASRQESA